MSSLRVLIAGGGIGGPAAAYWLSQINGCEVTVVERSPSLRATGQQIDLTGQGVVLTKLMDIDAAIKAARCPEPGMRVIDQHGGSKAFFPVDGGFSPTCEIEVMRGDLVRILYEAGKDRPGVRWRFGTHINHFAQDEGGSGAAGAGKVHVTFSDGSQDDYDVVIGADGIGSATRGLMLGSSSTPAHRRDLGAHIAFFTAPARPDDTHDWTVCNIPGGKCLMTRRDRADCIRVYLLVRSDAPVPSLDRAKTLAEQKAALAELFRGTPAWQVDRFTRALVESPEADDLYCQRLTQIRLPEGAWSRGRVVLLGDAAYCPGPIGGGIGTTAAMIGGYVLAGEIAKQWKAAGAQLGQFSAEKAAKEYERVMRPYIEGNSSGSTWSIRLAVPSSKFGIWLLHTLARLFVTLRLNKLVSAGKWGGQEQTTKLEYPDYFGVAEKASRT